MNRSDLYKQYLAASEGETGTETLDSMQKVYEESLQGRLNTLRSTVEGIFTKAFNTDDFYGMIDAVTKLVETFDTVKECMQKYSSVKKVLQDKQKTGNGHLFEYID